MNFTKCLSWTKRDKKFTNKKLQPPTTPNKVPTSGTDLLKYLKRRLQCTTDSKTIPSIISEFSAQPMCYPFILPFYIFENISPNKLRKKIP